MHTNQKQPQKQPNQRGEAMPIRIVLDHPGSQTRHQLARLIAWLLGALLVTIGLLATVVAIPSGFVTLGDLAGRWQHEQVVPPEVPVAKWSPSPWPTRSARRGGWLRWTM